MNIVITMLVVPGWLEKLTNWIKDTVLAVWEAFKDFIGDVLVNIIDMLLTTAAIAIEAIQVPDFVLAYSLGGLLGQGGDWIAWLIMTFKVGTGLTLIGAGWAFRLLRKLLTLGQW